jgi:phenylpropionate dioxygenase-like ring-hydroxylating dioxygenase large terminal subunit
VFEGFQRVWSPVAFASALTDRPIPVTLAGERLVLFRGASGPTALLDRCPHRGVALSLGTVRDGALACPFHGWTFGEGGDCLSVPYNPDAKRHLLCATSFPVRELGGLLWVFTGADPETEPSVPEALLDPSVSRWEHAQEWSCHWTRAMENMLDFPHLPFVHATTIGSGLRRVLRPDQRLDLSVEPRSNGFRVVAQLDGQQVGDLRWYSPNAMELVISTSPGSGLRAHVWCVPTAQGRTNMILCNTRGFATWLPPLKLVDQLNAWVVTQDRAICESHGPAPVPHPSEERSVATDGPTLRFRQWYLRHLAPDRDRPAPREPVTHVH